jgi:hypothetical protein
MVRYFDFRVLSTIRTSENAIGVFGNQSHQDALFAHGIADIRLESGNAQSGIFPDVLRVLRN